MSGGTDYEAGRADWDAGHCDVELAVASEAYRQGQQDARTAAVDAELLALGPAGPESETAGVEHDRQVNASLLAACPPELLEDLALLVDREGQMMLDAALQGELPSAFEVAEYRRRRAAVWARLSAQRPDRGDLAGQAYVERVAWQLAEVRHQQEAALRRNGSAAW